MGACTSVQPDVWSDGEDQSKSQLTKGSHSVINVNHADDIHAVHIQQIKANVDDHDDKSISSPSSDSCSTPKVNNAKLSANGYLRDIPLGAWFPAEHAHRDIAKLFTKHQEIARGATGSVYSISYQGQNYALKQISRTDEVGRMLFTTEARVLSNLQHTGVVKFVDMFVDARYYYLIVERADFNLYQVMQRKRYLSEKQTKRIVHDLLTAVRYLHRKNLVHRDLKPENIVFRKEEPNKPMLIDFGDAEMAKAEKVYTEFVGTAGYMSPERLTKHTGAALKKSDIWAVGVIAFEMFAGDRCFEGSSEQQVFKNIVRGQWEWPQDRMPSMAMQDFVAKCLELDSQQRPSARDALQHEWFVDMAEGSM